jgi:hypothetical protein
VGDVIDTFLSTISVSTGVKNAIFRVFSHFFTFLKK